MHVVRPAMLEDLPAMQAWNDWHHAKRESIEAGECHVAVIDGRPFGYGILNRSYFDRAWIALLFVVEAKRREGLGNALLEHMEDVCGAPRIWTSTELPNVPMQSLLKKRGYHLTGVVENLQKNPELFYYKDLSS
jgi:GNAT superfamily N-acetyltransferase